MPVLRRYFALFLAATTLIGCGSQSPTANASDFHVVSVGKVDTAPIDARAGAGDSAVKADDNAGSGGASGSDGTGDAVLGALGAPCNVDIECSSGYCLAAHHCSATCQSDADCPAGGWSCDMSKHVCQCSAKVTRVDLPTAVFYEVCDAVDNDCNGVVDDQPESDAACHLGGPEYSCQHGACACEQKSKCDGHCTDLQNDIQNCGNCGHVCATNAVCSAGQCTCPGGISAEGCDMCVLPTAANCPTCKELKPRCIRKIADSPTAIDGNPLMVDDQAAYWTGSGTFRVALTVKSPPVRLYGSSVGSTPFGGYVVGAVNGLWGIPKTGCDSGNDCGVYPVQATPSKAPGAGGSTNLVVYGNKLYWLDHDCAGLHALESPTGPVLDITPCTISTVGQFRHSYLAIDEKGFAAVVEDASGSEILHAPPAGGAFSILWSSTLGYDLNHILLTRDSIVTRDSNIDKILVQPRVGGAPTQLPLTNLYAQILMTGVRDKSTSPWYFSYSGGQGCNIGISNTGQQIDDVIPLVAGETPANICGSSSIAVDGEHVYWIMDRTIWSALR